jgi:hypothetical protein
MVRAMVEVIGYEKTAPRSSAGGNQPSVFGVLGRADLDAVIALDRACFPVPWVKGAEILVRLYNSHHTLCWLSGAVNRRLRISHRSS